MYIALLSLEGSYLFGCWAAEASWMFLALRPLYRHMVRTCSSETCIFDTVQDLRLPLPENISRHFPPRVGTSLNIANEPYLNSGAEVEILINWICLAFCALHGMFLDCPLELCLILSINYVGYQHVWPCSSELCYKRYKCSKLYCESCLQPVPQGPLKKEKADFLKEASQGKPHGEPCVLCPHVNKFLFRLTSHWPHAE